MKRSKTIQRTQRRQDKASDRSDNVNVTVSEIALWALENSPDTLGDFLDVSDTELATLKESIKQQQFTGLRGETP